MMQEGIPETLKRKHGNLKRFAKEAALGCQSVIKYDRSAYDEAVELIGTPNAFPFVDFFDEDASSSSEDEDASATKKART